MDTIRVKKEAVVSMLNTISTLLGQIQEFLHENKEKPGKVYYDPERIIDVVQEHFVVNLKNTSRKPVYYLARSAAAYLLQQHTDLGLVEIAEEVYGNRDHSSVIRAIERFREKLEIDNFRENEFADIKFHLQQA